MSQASIAIRFKPLILLLILCINIAACDKDNTNEEVLSEIELVNIGDDLELW